MGFVTLDQELVFPADGTQQVTAKHIEQTQIEYYTNNYLDTSAFELIDFAKHLTTYSVEKSVPRLINDTGNKVSQVITGYVQSRRQETLTFSINSLDITLGLVGGLSGIIWAIMELVAGGYESFQFENSLIGSIFPTSPQNFESELVDGTESKARRAMMRTVAERGKYFYHYGEYFLFSCLRSYCCCFTKGDRCQRRMRRLERHEEASEKLIDELDVVKYVYVNRIGQFLAKMILKKHQRALVTSFKKYQVDDLGEKADRERSPSSYLLTPQAQADGMVDDFAIFEND